MKLVLIVGLGSFVGGSCRFLLGQLVQYKNSGAFPFATLIVNLLGCLLIGVLFGLAEKLNWSQELKSFLMIGLLGGFTTFSAFSNDCIQMISSSQYFAAFTYLSLSVFGGLAVTYLGLQVTK